ncbi:hypothetical protein H6F90_20110 [Trichocoleus sp. FACHB-591]|uniref:SMODS domain-containing nucleotidyltransferase n=1 Tax=Trichocoleus sp. FACHB-591 TaxID=2692872 RepID=UPI00168684A4|nr:hypothetical protein [Trichocoleus sp. FACHB-591]MBD2097406.1 hypothetical protein [Trichocoleus sp. FACHB-591]
MEIPSYFRRYLCAIQPTRSSRERAVQLHTTLTKRLSSDRHFKDWYHSSFLYGSYRRNTAIQPIKDVDVCVVLNINPNEHQPEAVVRRIRRALERNNYDAKTALQRRSVRVDMSRTTLDVVPVIAPNGLDQPLLIPDRPLKKWVDTHPKGHLAAATRINQECNKRYIPLVKIVKAWYRYQMRTLRNIEQPKPKGFTLEALVATYQDSDAPSYAEAFVNFLNNLHRDCGASLINGVFPTVDDPGLPGQTLKVRFTEDEAKQFGEVIRINLDAAHTALGKEQGSISECAVAWNHIFGPNFPTEPTSLLKTAGFKVEQGTKGDETEDEEIAEIELLSASSLGKLKIKAELAYECEGPILQNHPSGSRALAKNMWLRFSIIETTVSLPYEIRWIVKNHGSEAREAQDFGHMTTGKTVQWKHTKYRGSHTMTCELHRNGVLLARAKHTVNIK